MISTSTACRLHAPGLKHRQARGILVTGHDGPRGSGAGRLTSPAKGTGHRDQGSQTVDQKRKSALRRWRDRRKLRRIERLERKITSRENLRDFRQWTGEETRYK